MVTNQVTKISSGQDKKQPELLGNLAMYVSEICHFVYRSLTML